MYIIQEIQTGTEGTALLPPVQRENRNEAESAFYIACGYAAVSTVPVHTVMVFTEEGFAIPELTKCFKH